MANNRMFIINKRLGLKYLLAKYYPSTGWFIFKNDASANGYDRIHKLDDMFDQDEDISSHGATDWEIVYESAEDKSKEIDYKQFPINNTTSTPLETALEAVSRLTLGAVKKGN
jgi:hypothetical protein